MKSLFQTKLGALLTAALLVAISAVTANAQEPSRLQLSSLDHLAAKACHPGWRGIADPPEYDQPKPWRRRPDP